MTEKSTAEVVIDSNESSQNPEIIELVSSHPDIEEWYVDNLEDGDLIVNDSVCIERKSPSDFSSSLTEDENRLYNQAESMRDSDYDYCFILLEGNVGEFEDLEYGPTETALRGAMASVTIRYGIPVVPVEDMEILVDYATRLGRKAIEEPSSTTFKSGTITKTDVPVEVRMLSGIEGIDEVSAFNLYSRYGSIQAILEAPIEDMTQTPSIGRTRAESVLEALRGTQKGSENKSWTND